MGTSRTILAQEDGIARRYWNQATYRIAGLIGGTAGVLEQLGAPPLSKSVGEEGN
jgi:hypothetical protein